MDFWIRNGGSKKRNRENENEESLIEAEEEIDQVEGITEASEESLLTHSLDGSGDIDEQTTKTICEKMRSDGLSDDDVEVYQMIVK